MLASVAAEMRRLSATPTALIFASVTGEMSWNLATETMQALRWETFGQDYSVLSVLCNLSAIYVLAKICYLAPQCSCFFTFELQAIWELCASTFLLLASL